MCAQLIKFGDSPPGLGGDFEREVNKKLTTELSANTLVLTNVNLPSKDSFFYEYDVILLNPSFCEIIEAKFMFSHVKVYENWFEGVNNYIVSSVFSILENKAKVLKGKFKDPRDAFYWPSHPYVGKRVIMGPENTSIEFKHKPHSSNKQVVHLDEAIKCFRDFEKQGTNSKDHNSEFIQLRAKILKYAQNLDPNSKRAHRIGRFYIKRPIQKSSNCDEYWACDEYPCPVDVHLKEFPFNPLDRPNDIELYLKHATTAMQILRKLRHEYLHCVIGHFQTGYSLVQISDWFDSDPIENKWKEIADIGINEKISIMKKVAQGMAYCHSKGVFHRGLSATQIRINNELDDIRIGGFEWAKDINLTATLTSSKLHERESKIIPPEEIAEPSNFKNFNYRLYDIYQTGLLFYRIIENGRWPFASVLDYCTSPSFSICYNQSTDETSCEEIEQLITKMISINPKDRPDPMERIIDRLNEILGR